MGTEFVAVRLLEKVSLKFWVSFLLSPTFEKLLELRVTPLFRKRGCARATNLFDGNVLRTFALFDKNDATVIILLSTGSRILQTPIWLIFKAKVPVSCLTTDRQGK